MVLFKEKKNRKKELPTRGSLPIQDSIYLSGQERIKAFENILLSHLFEESP